MMREGKYLERHPLVPYTRGILAHFITNMSGDFKKSAINLMNALLCFYVINHKLGMRVLERSLVLLLNSTFNSSKEKKVQAHCKY